MRLKRITYDELNSKQKEIYNFQKLAALLGDYGFNCIKLDDDWQGADFLVVPVKQTVTYRASFGHVELFQEYRKPLRSK